MATGIEGPLVSAVTGGATRALGWGGRQALSVRRRDQTRKLLKERSVAAAISDFEKLDGDTMMRIVQLLETPEIEHVAHVMSRAHLLEKRRQNVDRLLETVNLELQQTVRLLVGRDTEDSIIKSTSDLLYGILSAAVTAQISTVSSNRDVSTKTYAELVDTAAAVAAASARNIELLRQMSTIAEYRAFESQLRAQIIVLHGGMRLPHAGTTQVVAYDQLFVEPHILVYQNSQDRGQSAPSKDDSARIHEFLTQSNRLLVLGDPGAGKSTISQKLAHDVASSSLPSALGGVPFFVTLRDYARHPRTSIVEYIETRCAKHYSTPAPLNAVEYLLLNGRSIVIFDGLDELLETSQRREIVQVVEGFASRYPTTQILVTSRKVGYSDAPLNPTLFPKAELQEFDYEQITKYATNWFRLDESLSEHRNRTSLTIPFMRDSQLVSDLRSNPLMLSLICGLYATDGYIPRNRPDVYERCALLLFERWDRERDINPNLKFDAHIKMAMRSLALYMYTNKGQNGLPRRDLVRYMTRYLFEKRFDNENDAEDAANGFIDFCRGRAWVLTDVGPEVYGFTHQTFLEYFAASQLVRLFPSASELYAQFRQRIMAREWDVVAQLSVQILDRNVENGADDFLTAVIEEAETTSIGSEPHPDVALLSFAARAAQFVVPGPRVLRKIVVSCLDHYTASLQQAPTSLGKSRLAAAADTEPLVDLCAASVENAPRIASVLREEIGVRLVLEPKDDALLQIALLPLRGRATSGLGGMHPSDLQLWVDWRAKNANLFIRYIAAQRKLHTWVAIYSFERGDITFMILKGMRGLERLYEPVLDSLSFAARFINRTEGERSFEGLDGMIESDRLFDIAEDIVRGLLKTHTPWIKYAHEGINLREFQDPASILLALPILEGESIALRDVGAGASRRMGRLQNPTSAIRLRELRESAHPLRTDISRLIDELDLQGSTAGFLRSWLIGDVHCLASRS